MAEACTFQVIFRPDFQGLAFGAQAVGIAIEITAEKEEGCPLHHAIDGVLGGAHQDIGVAISIDIAGSVDGIAQL